MFSTVPSCPPDAIWSPGDTVGAAIVNPSMKPTTMIAHLISDPATSARLSRPRDRADRRISAEIPRARSQNRKIIDKRHADIQ